MGCLREREEGGGREGERVRRASAPAVCRYFYQHELERGGGREQGVRWEKYEGVSKKENEKIWEKFIRVGGVVGGGYVKDAGQWENGMGGGNAESISRREG